MTDQQDGQNRLPTPWPYHAHRPQRYVGNYARYRSRGGMVRPEEDVQGFVAGGRNRGDMARSYFFCVAFDQIVKEALAGDLAELGVWKGNTATLLATMARRLGRTAYLLDTYEGFSASDLHGIDAGARPEAFRDTSLPEVRTLVGEQNVRFIKGHFPDTISQLPDHASFCLVHIDCDLYAPMMSALQYFYPRMVPGGFLIVHDYSNLAWPGAERAVDEFFSDKPEPVVPLPDGAGSAVIRKSRTPDGRFNWLLARRYALLREEWTEAAGGGISELLGKGWSRAESWGVWGVGEVHELLLVVPADAGDHLDLEADVHGALLGARQAQQVDVGVGEETIGCWEFTRQRNHRVRSVRIPMRRAEDEHWLRIGVEFRPRSVARPCDLDSRVKEARTLGLGLHRVRGRISSAGR